MIRVLLADDHPLVRAGLAQFLRTTGGMKVVAEASSGEEVFEKIRETNPEVLVLDLSMPGLSGRELIAKLKATWPLLGIVILTMKPEDAFAVQLLREGASAFLNKGRRPEEVVEAIACVADGRRHLTSTLADLLLARPDVGNRLPHDALTGKEFDVFLGMIEGLTVSEVAFSLGITPSTASSHLASIRQKLGVQSNGELIRYAFRAGLAKV